jgi:hypothetical protein
MEPPAYQDRPCLTDEQFDTVRTKFESLADRLCDEQMLELADIYHRTLRERRAIRARHPLRPRPADGHRPDETPTLSQH